MKIPNLAACLAFLSFAALGLASPLTKPLAAPELVIEESDGFVAAEAEHFFEQEKAGVRAWYLTTADKAPGLKPDADGNHAEGAGGGAYLEILPDTRKNHGEKLIWGENFMNDPGKMAVLSYKVYFNTPGKYYVWARTHSTGTEDNGLHVGIDGEWPASGQRMQWTGKKKWVWGSKQRTEKVHGGVPGLLFLEIDEAGEHVIQFSMREDGFEFDQWLMTTDPDFKAPDGAVLVSKAKAGKAPKGYSMVAAERPTGRAAAEAVEPVMGLSDFEGRERLYIDGGKWFAINPGQNRDARATGAWPFGEGLFDVTLHAVGENDGRSAYVVFVEGEKVGDFESPLSGKTVEEGGKFSKTFKGLRIDDGAMIEVVSAIGSEDGEESSRARWSGLSVASADGEEVVRVRGQAGKAPGPEQGADVSFDGDLFGERGEDGAGEVAISGELKEWHKVSLTLEGPFAHEKDNQPNPFMDYRFDVVFTPEKGEAYTVPGYFAADGEAGESSADSGNCWRAHFAPDRVGKWKYRVVFREGKGAAIDAGAPSDSLAPFDGIEGSFVVAPSDKSGRDLRGKGRLEYVGKHHLRFAGSGEYFLKAGADAPETFLGYADFDGTVALKPDKSPLKTWGPHVRDWTAGDPTWKGDKGKGMIGAINYLSGKGCNVFSFLPYNAGGDGENVWPFVGRDEKFHYDCSKLDQWGVIFDHATAKGMYLHFKLQETENDDNRRGGHKGGGESKGQVRASLDGGDLGPERKLYCRELVARFGHNLALNWNLGEENTQSTDQQRDMAQYIADTDAYDHLIVVHTFPNQQDQVYRPLLGDASAVRGASLQNSNIKDCHHQIVKWTRESAAAGVPWVVAFDEPGTASEGMPADPGYPGMPDDFDNPSIDDTRKYVLWGTLLGGGGGVEYYFGYKLPQSDLNCEDWRSRDRSWDYCRIALEFFGDEEIPFGDMLNRDELVGNVEHDNSAYCFAKEGVIYLVYLPKGGERELDLASVEGRYTVQWFNPREGGAMTEGGEVGGGGAVVLKAPDAGSNDWLAVLRRK